MLFNRFSSLLLCLGLLLGITNCTDPIIAGAELLSGDRASVGFSDTLSVRSTIITGDSVLAGAANLVNYYFGREVDDYFGTTEAGIFIKPRLRRGSTGRFISVPDSINFGTVDSFFLALPLDSAGIFGDISGNSYGMDVFQLTEEITGEEQDNGSIFYFSNADYAFNPSPIGSATFTPSYDTTFLGIFSNNADDSFDTLSARHVRIPLDLALGQQLLQLDTTVYENDTLFNNEIPGLYLRPTGSNTGLIDFNMSSSVAGMYLYYTLNGESYSYFFTLGGLTTNGPRVSQYVHDYGSAQVNDAISPILTRDDSLLYVQGLQGLLTVIDVPALSSAEFKNRVINKAELEFTVAMPDDYDYTSFPPLEQIVLLTDNEDNTGYLLIEDAVIIPNDLSTYFGGQPTDETNGTITYTMNMGIHAQYIINGTQEKNLYLAATPRAGNAQRVILKGPGALENPPRLKVSFTDF